MSPEREKLVMTPELSEEFEGIQERYRSLDMDLSADLDDQAEKNAPSFKRTGVVYPKKGSLEERWLALREACRMDQKAIKLKGLLERVRSHTDQLKAASEDSREAYLNALKDEPDLIPDALEPGLIEEEDENPELKSLIEELRKSLRELDKYLP